MRRSALVSGVRVDNTTPTGSIADPGGYLRNSVSLAGTAADEGSGVATVAFQRSPANAETWTTIETDTADPYGAALDTTALADGLYDLRVLVTDDAGNESTASIANRRVDNTKPTAALADPGAALNAGVTLDAPRRPTTGAASPRSSSSARRPARARGRRSRPTRPTRTPRRSTRPSSATGSTTCGGRDRSRRQPGELDVGHTRVDNTAPTTSASGVPSGPTPGPVTITLAA